MTALENTSHRALRRWKRSAVLALALLLLTFLGLSLYADTAQLGAALTHFDASVLAPALGFSLLSYLLRASRFQLFLRSAAIEVPHNEAVLVFLSGMSLSATPGKVGEVLKSVLLKQRYGVPLAASVPIVVMERVSDLIALLALTALGVAILPRSLPLCALLAGLALLLVLLSSMLPKLQGSGLLQRAPLPARWHSRVNDLSSSFSSVARPGLLLSLTPFGLLSWSCQVLCLWTVVRGFEGALELQAATFAYCVPLLAGVLALLPGGLGVTEAGMVHTLQLVAPWTTPALAASITLLVRLATFWFAIAVGLAALVTHRRYFPWRSPVAPVEARGI